MTTINRDQIKKLVMRLNYVGSAFVPSIIKKIDESIHWAWDNWEDSIIQKYYVGEKPSLPTEQFIYEWIENEDFEADGYNIQELTNL